MCYGNPFIDVIRLFWRDGSSTNWFSSVHEHSPLGFWVSLKQLQGEHSRQDIKYTHYWEMNAFCQQRRKHHKVKNKKDTAFTLFTACFLEQVSGPGTVQVRKTCTFFLKGVTEAPEKCVQKWIPSIAILLFQQKQKFNCHWRTKVRPEVYFPVKPQGRGQWLCSGSQKLRRCFAPTKHISGPCSSVVIWWFPLEQNAKSHTFTHHDPSSQARTQMLWLPLQI